MVELSFSGSRSRATSPALKQSFVNTGRVHPLCGNREWSLRPPARTTHLEQTCRLTVKDSPPRLPARQPSHNSRQ